MTAINPPYALQSRTDHSATGMRAAFGSMIGGATLGATSPRSGVNPMYGNRLQVTGSGSIMQASVNTGMCWVSTGSAWSGAYHCVNDASVNITIAAAHATQYRRDLIIAQVEDTSFGDGVSAWKLAVVQGTNSAGAPAPLPTVPSRSLILGTIRVDPAITNLSGKVDDSRTYFGGLGAVPCTNTTNPSSPHAGLIIYEYDTQTLKYYDGSAYQYLSSGASWKAYTPSWTAASVNPSLGNGSITGRYVQLGKQVLVRANITSGTTTTYGSGQYRISLPVNSNTSYGEQYIPCRVYNTSLVYVGQANIGNGTYGFLQVHNGGAILNVTNTSPSTWSGAGNLFSFEGSYEAA